MNWKKYDQQTEALKTQYEGRIIALLTRIRNLANDSGYEASEPFDMHDSDYNWHIQIEGAKQKLDGTVSIDFTIEESKEMEGSDDGIAFALHIVAEGGQVLGDMTPYNYSPELWIALDNPEAIEERFLLFETADITAILPLLRKAAPAEPKVTDVIFRVWRKKEYSNSVIAIFPAVPEDAGGRYCVSYEHVGQHSGADYFGVVEQTRLAEPEEYAALKRELESEPYKYVLRVCKRKTAKHRRDFSLTLKAWLTRNQDSAVKNLRDKGSDTHSTTLQKERLEYLRAELRAERISYGELAELQELIPFIDKGDVELLEAAGVPEGSGEPGDAD